MSTIDSLRALLVEQMKDIYDAEKRLTKALPKMRKAAANEELQQAIDDHLAETEEHVTRLEQAFEMLDEKPKAKACAGMRGIIEEGQEHVGEDYDEDDIRDAVIIGSAQRVEHYEIAAYGTAIAHAKLLGENDLAELLHETLEEEKAVVNIEAAQDDDEEEENEEAAPGRGGKQGGRRSTTAMPRAVAAESARGKRGRSR
jgi:ferritin-like metal-binding protein YciE